MSIYISSAPGSGSGSLIPPASAKEIFVAQGGSDSTGNGSLGSPFATVTHALSTVSSPTSTSPYLISVGPGVFAEATPLVLTPWTWIRGVGNYGTTLNIGSGTGALTAGSGFASADAMGGLYGLRIEGDVNLDMHAAGGAFGATIEIAFCSMVNLNMTGRATGTDTLKLFTSFVDVTFSENSVALLIEGCFLPGITVRTDYANTTSSVWSCNWTGVIDLDASGAFGLTFTMTGSSPFADPVNANGAVRVAVDSVSYPSYGGLNLTGGASVFRFNDPNGLFYFPTTGGDWNTAPTTAQEAIDTLATSGVVASQAQNLILASPNGSSGVPSFRALVAADLPASFGISSMTNWTAYTPTFSAAFGTVSASSVVYRRVGDTLEVSGTFTPGTTTSAAGTISLPAGLAIDTTKFAAVANKTLSVGGLTREYTTGGANSAIFNGTNSVSFSLGVDTGSTGTVFVAQAVNSNALVAAAISSFIASGNNLSFSFRVPIAGWAASQALGAVTAPTIQKFTSTGSTTGYLFTVTSANATVGATYTNNSNTYTVLATISGATQLFCSQASSPQSSGTLTKSGGTGDATITFSAARAIATYNTPANVLYIRVRMVGGGGGGSGGGVFPQGSGSAGTASIFGTSPLSAGGGGGATNNGGTPGSGGTSSLGSGPIGTTVVGGGGGGSVIYFSSGSTNVQGGGGGGGSSMLGGGASASDGGSGGFAGVSASANTGGGGSGGGGGNNANAWSGGGGGGGGGVDAIITSPAASYPYTIGAGGSGGSAGSSGGAGGAGAAGYIEVTEYYQ